MSSDGHANCRRSGPRHGTDVAWIQHRHDLFPPDQGKTRATRAAVRTLAIAIALCACAQSGGDPLVLCDAANYFGLRLRVITMPYSRALVPARRARQLGRQLWKPPVPARRCPATGESGRNGTNCCWNLRRQGNLRRKHRQDKRRPRRCGRPPSPNVMRQVPEHAEVVR